MSAAPLQPRAASPDPAAWLEAHGDYLFSYAMVRVDNTEIAEDLVQETLLAALEGQHTFQNRSSLRTWLVGILKHKMIDYFRRTAAEKARSLSPPPDPESPPPPESESGVEEQASEDALRDWLDKQFKKSGKWAKPPARWRQPGSRNPGGPHPGAGAGAGGRHPGDPQTLSPWELDELRNVLADCLDRLPPRACEAILLTERSNMPAEKVGKVLEVSTTNLGVLLFRARTALRHCLEVHWFGRKNA